MIIQVPIIVEEMNQVDSIQMDVVYDGNIAAVQDVMKSEATNNFLLLYNVTLSSSDENIVRIGLISTDKINGTETVVYILFETEASAVPIEIKGLILNDTFVMGR